MSPVEMKTILEYLMSKLSDAELAELDEMLAGGSTSEPVQAADSKRREWIALDARARIAARRARQNRIMGTPAERAEYAARFPNAGRLK